MALGIMDLHTNNGGLWKSIKIFFYDKYILVCKVYLLIYLFVYCFELNFLNLTSNFCVMYEQPLELGKEWKKCNELLRYTLTVQWP